MPSSQLDFRLLFEAVPGPYLVLDSEFTIVAVTEAYLKATMTSRSKILGRGLFEIFPDNPEDSSATGTGNLRASLERVKLQRRSDTMAVQKYDIRRPESEGGGFEERFWSPINAPVLNEHNEVSFIIHGVQDVTEFVRLKQSGSQLDQLNESLRTRAGQMEADVYRRAQEIQEANSKLYALQNELESRVEVRTVELQRANEALLRSEEQLRQSQKLEAIGQLAGGVAHDFNNLLSVILSYTEIASWGLKKDDPVRSDLEEVQKAGSRAAELTRQLLAFSRRQVLDFRVLDLNDVVANLNKMLVRVLGEDIELRTVLSAKLSKVRADPGQIEQVLMNLAVNARDAMPNGGKLTIETANVELSENHLAGEASNTAGPHVMLAVSDTGTGMTKETRSRIFEPFFTTKEQGKGTGLGLSTVFGIVKQSEGHIWVYSEPGEGTTFKVYLPRTAGASTWTPRVVPQSTTVGGHETLLLVEDEDQVRAVAAGILRRLGYNVLETRSPGEALLASEQYGGHIDLLLTDIVMPLMNGRELSKRICATRPGICTLFMSGYTDSVILHHGVLDPSASFLQKPFNPESLARKVRDVLTVRQPQNRTLR